MARVRSEKSNAPVPRAIKAEPGADRTQSNLSGPESDKNAAGQVGCRFAAAVDSERATLRRNLVWLSNEQWLVLPCDSADRQRGRQGSETAMRSLLSRPLW